MGKSGEITQEEIDKILAPLRDVQLALDHEWGAGHEDIENAIGDTAINLCRHISPFFEIDAGKLQMFYLMLAYNRERQLIELEGWPEKKAQNYIGVTELLAQARKLDAVTQSSLREKDIERIVQEVIRAADIRKLPSDDVSVEHFLDPEEFETITPMTIANAIVDHMAKQVGVGPRREI